MRMRTLTLSVFCLTAAALAQTPGQGRGNGAGLLAMVQRLRQIIQNLNLTSDQKTKVNAVLDQARQDGTQLRSQLQSLSGQERLQKVRDFATDVKNKIEAELTPEQKETFEKKLTDARAEGVATLGSTVLDRLRSNLDSLNLTDDQREKANALVKDTVDKLKGAGTEQDPSKKQTTMRDVMQTMREKLSEFLTPEQLQDLRQKMQKGGGAASDRPARRANAETTTSSPATQPTMMQDDAPAKPLASAAKPATPAGTPIAAGTTAPDFKLLRLDGQPLQLSSFKGKVVALVFGSYTCPTFRDRAIAINHLSHDVDGKANVFLIYTSEAHPAGGWEVERNNRDNIQIRQPATDIARKAVARQARDALHLNIPILMDAMDNAVTTEYGTFPNGAAVVNRDGVVVGTQQWADATSLRHMIDEAVGEKTP